jgi:hypothetical protein
LGVIGNFDVLSRVVEKERSITNMGTNISFTSGVLPNCNLKIWISTYTKIFHGKNDQNSPNFKENINPNHHIFMRSSSR